jgi:hypothetical protein
VNPGLRERLLAMAAADERLRTELVRDGTLFEGYNPRMAELHDRNGAELAAIIAEVGWPGCRIAGEDGAAAAWRVLQHAIGTPALQRSCLPLLRKAAADGDVAAAYPAWLEDRIAFFERRPQQYGTQFDWDADGQMSPWPIADPEGVHRFRAAVGLPSLAEQQQQIRAVVTAQCEKPPGDYESRQREIRAWAEQVGWILASSENG